MNTATAFENRKDSLRSQLEEAQNAGQAASALSMTLEQIACDLAQDEQDLLARQRQQAVMALAKRAPDFLRAACAEGQLVLIPQEEPPHWRRALNAQSVGLLLLLGSAIYAVLDGRTALAFVQAAGALLMLPGVVPTLPWHKESPQMTSQPKAQGVLRIDTAQALREVGELCQAVDICTSDLQLIEKDGGSARLSGTADNATLDLLCAMMEAKASGRPEMATRCLGQAEQYLHMLGIEPVFYAPEEARYFDVLPTLGGARTVRPALLQDGQLLRRGVAAVGMQKEVGA